VVDDSVIYRKAIIKELQGIPEISSIEQASNGKEAVRKYQASPTDLVTLDIEMPLMSGLEVLPEILKINPKAKVMMISSLTVKGASTTMQALQMGATDFITKEQAFGLRDDQKDRLGVTLNEKLAQLIAAQFAGCKSASLKNDEKIRSEPQEKKPFASTVSRTPSAVKSSGSPPSLADKSSKNPVSLLLIGSSTGGPQTLHTVFKQMPTRRNYPTVVVQHMPPIFTAQLAANIAKTTGHHCVEASEGLVLEKDMIVIAKGGHHLVLEKNGQEWVCHLTETEPVNSCRPSVDVTFESVAQHINRPEVVATMLTGMGNDGAAGMHALCEKRVPILTQDKASCVVYGMPKAVDDLGITWQHANPTFMISECEKYMLRPEAM
jgi:two-component system chemotaxis response regulator CheB